MRLPATARSVEGNGSTDPLTQALEHQLSHPATSPEFDLHRGVNQVLADLGMTTADCCCKLAFYGRDPILPSRIRFGTITASSPGSPSSAISRLLRKSAL